MTQRELDRRSAESAYSRGSLKIKIGRLKKDGVLKKDICLFCNKEILRETEIKMFTQNGSDHKCKGFKDHYLKNASPN